MMKRDCDEFCPLKLTLISVWRSVDVLSQMMYMAKRFMRKAKRSQLSLQLLDCPGKTLHGVCDEPLGSVPVGPAWKHSCAYGKWQRTCRMKVVPAPSWACGHLHQAPCGSDIETTGCHSNSTAAETEPACSHLSTHF